MILARLTLAFALTVLAGWNGNALAAGNADESVDFARDILPILSDKCFACHGPDTQKKGALRLDSLAEATRDLGGYQAVNPSKPSESELLRRIHDPQDPMPPADAEKTLTDSERALLTEWIHAGGAYAEHWAFVPPQKKPAPGMQDGLAKKERIDAYLKAALARHGWDFAPQAQRATLARRAALVLTGLPPERALLDSFLQDASEEAYETYVDALLDQPAFGEHQARYWLDAVRYGDTHGLHLDNRRGIYPYRDWVVRAFNRNLPFDQFIVWQLAGDLLPDPTMEQLVATGFVRMNPTTSEGGVLPEEFQAKNNFDRTENLGTVFLGLTLTCARCHTHKYDPITQTEYYRLLAFFNSTAEKPLDGNAYEYGPTLEVPPNQEAWREWMNLAAQREQWLALAAPLIPPEPKDSPWKTRDWQWRTPPASASAGDKTGEPPWNKVSDLPGKSENLLPSRGESVEVKFTLTTANDDPVWLTFAGGPDSFATVQSDQTTLKTQSAGETLNWHAVMLRLQPGNHEVRLHLRGTDSQIPVEIWLEDPSSQQALARRWHQASDDERLALLAAENGPWAHLRLQTQTAALRERMTTARTNFTTTLIAQDLNESRPTHVLRRGEYNLPAGDPLEPGVLQVLNPYPENAPQNRLGLARWLTAPENPLVARVLVNRIWQTVFGQGLVRTPEDFGRQGQQPTHPALLDWLAVEFQESGWDMKHMIRLMVTSRAFRQSSAVRPEIADPENRWWARGPSFRLDAEVLRDVGLWASDLLDPTMGGEGVKPYQPEGLWLAMAHPASNTKKYERDTGRRLYRRSLYVYWKRTSPHPMMTLFDAPSRESSCVRRSRTNTPLQSLGLLNETQRLEMARMLAQRLLQELDSDEARLEEMFLLLACRPPRAEERDACISLLQSMKSRYDGREKDALALLSIGEAARDESLPTADLAAWTQVASTFLASDAVILLY